MTQPNTLTSLFETLLPTTSLTHPPLKPQYAHLTPQIADLHVHPTLEALLHILNHDLPSAHFLVRHMQAPPAVEGMLLHGILHRAEGDFGNARAWIGDVRDACEGFRPKKKEQGEKLDESVSAKVGCEGLDKSLVEFVYSRGEDDAMRLVDDVEDFRREKGRVGGEEIEARIRREAVGVMEWCRRKFGDGVWEDATGAWVKNSEEIREISEGMVSGGRGWREF